VADAVDRGADALGMAGGDGSMAVVAAAACAYDLPFACVPAGTRNHFARDLGVQRGDVVGALEAFTDGLERRIDVGEVNGSVFVDNVILGFYGDAVRQEGYRDARLQTLLTTAQEALGPRAPASGLAIVDDRARSIESPRS
jgi:diacylglycerol kinase family enzyme